MKYLIIFAVGAVLIAFVYRRLRPYIQGVRKFVNLASTIVNQDGMPERTTGENKLTRCVSCGTWVPANRVIGSGASRYCSTECLEKPRSEDRKVSNIR